MEQSIFKLRYRGLALMILCPLILVVSLSCYDGLCPAIQAQPPAEITSSQTEKTDNLPKIKQVVFFQEENTSRYWIRQAQVVSTDGKFRLSNIKTLFSDLWQEVPNYSVSPNRMHLLVTRYVPTGANIDQDLNNLLLVSLPTGKIKTLRGDGSGYHMLGWSSDSQLISYISYEGVIPYIGVSPPRMLYISAVDGKWRRKLQAKVTDAVWIPERKSIVYTSYEKPGLVVYSSDGKKAVLSKDEGGGSLMLSGDGRKLLWSDGPKLRLFEIPKDSSKLLDPNAWKIAVEFGLDPNRSATVIGLSYDGTMVALRGPDIQTPVPGDGIHSSTRLAVLNLITKKSVVYSLVGNVYRLGWSQDGRYLFGGYFQPSKNGESADMAAIQVDPSSVNHTGTINWDNPQPITPQILLEMPLQTKSITWRE